MVLSRVSNCSAGKADGCYSAGDLGEIDHVWGYRWTSCDRGNQQWMWGPTRQGLKEGREWWWGWGWEEIASVACWLLICFLPPPICMTPHVRHQAFVPVQEFVTSPYLKFQLVRNVSASIGLSPAKAAKDPSMYPTEEKSASTTQPCCDESIGQQGLLRARFYSGSPAATRFQALASKKVCFDQ